jgi:tetraacyldisaccharide 4'-kinase
MKTPAFWRARGPLATMLSPLGLITGQITARRVQNPGFCPGIPVYCAGNATVGGAGKTILALDLLARLPGRPFALTRGFRGRLAGPILVNPARHTAREVGDEALLLAAAAPTILARDRAAGAQLAVAEGATSIVMDDGLQNPGLAKTVAFLVIDGGFGFGNSLLFPAGPLREPAAAAAGRCQAAVLIGADTSNAAAALPKNLAILRATLTPVCAQNLAQTPVIAFAGIGRPEKFFASVTELGADIRAKIPYPDHHNYTAADATRLLALAARLRAQLVTTTKDQIKLPPALRDATLPVTVILNWADQAAVEGILRERPGGRCPPGPPTKAEGP